MSKSLSNTGVNMKQIYEFDFQEGSDDSYQIYLIEKRLNMSLALWDLSQKFREWCKYGDREAIPVEEIKDTFYDILEENDINLDKLCL